MTDGTSLVRRGRRNAHYTAIPNHIIDHPGLSPEARITQIYLLSKPDDWQLQVNDLRRLLGTVAKRCGRNKAYEVIKELKTAGYVVAVEELQHGRFHGVTYYVFDEPLLDTDGFKAELRGGGPANGRGAAASTASGAKEPRPEIRDTAPAPHPQFRDPVKRQLTKDRKKQITERPPSPPSPSDDRSPKACREGRWDFRSSGRIGLIPRGHENGAWWRTCSVGFLASIKGMRFITPASIAPQEDGGAALRG